MGILSFKIQGVVRTDSAVARELLKGPGFAGLSERSLAAYLGDLRRGKSRWWRNRPTQLQAVLDLAGLDLADLGLSHVAQAKAYAFSTFPALRPLDLLGESLPNVYEDVELRKDWGFKTDLWLAPDLRHPLDRPSPGIYWLQILPGHGLDLLWQQLLARDHAHCVELAALGRTLPEQPSGKPMILRVAQPLEVDMYGSADMALPMSPVLVLSRHPPPLVTESDSSLPEFKLRQLLGLSQPIVRGGMRRQLADDWQDHLVAWAIERVQGDDTLLSEADVQRWVDRMLPYRSVVSTPEELIALCGILHQSSHVHRSSSSGATLFRACMNNHGNTKRLAKLIKHRYLHGSAPWDEPIPPDQWAQHLQQGMADTDSLSSLVASLVEEKSVAQRRKAQAKLLTLTAESALSQLQDDRSLVRYEDGCYHMRLPFVANALAADEVVALVAGGRTEEWARFYLDPSRRVVVEMALWRRSLDELLNDSKHVLTRSETPLVQLAAEEALFWTIGLKLAHLQTSISASAQGVLQGLVGRIVGRIEKTSAQPATRDLQAPDEALAWMAVCWHWSISVELPPAMSLPSALAWLFPGWAGREGLVDYLPSHLPFESSEVLADAGRRAGRGAWTMWWRAAQRIANDLSAPPAEPPDALAPALVLSGLRHGWRIDPSWIRVMANPGALKPSVRQSIGELDATALKRLLDALLTAISWRTTQAKSDPLHDSTRQWQAMMLPTSWLAQDVVGKLDAGSAIDVAGPSRLVDLILCLDAKNAAFVRELAQAIPRRREWSEVFGKLVPILPGDSWETVVEWLNHAPRMDLAQWLWKIDTARTVALLFQGSRLDAYAMLFLVTATPDQHVSDVAEFLSDTRCPVLRGHRAQWALTRLPHHGLNLEKLVNELTQEEWIAQAI